MPYEIKKSKIVVRDSNGELVQIMPETSASLVAYGDTNVASKIQSLEENAGGGPTYAEVDPHSKTETVDERIQHSGSISPYSSAAFSLVFGYMDESSGQYGTVQKIVMRPSRAMTSNAEYSFSFSLSEIPQGISISTDWYITDKNGITANIGFNVSANSDTAAGGASYESWEGNTSTSSSLVKADFPEGTRREFTFNSRTFWGTPNSLGTVPFPDLGMTVALTRLEGTTNYVLDFYWDYSETVQVERTTRWKMLKTTVENPSGENSVISKPISGLLQDVTHSREDSFAIVGSPSEGTYHPYVYVNDDRNES